jgi:hypothetical protein
MDSRSFHDVVSGYFAFKAVDAHYDPDTKTFTGTLYGSFAFRCRLGPERFSARITNAPGMHRAGPFGTRLTRDAGLPSILNGLEQVDQWCRRRLPRTFLEEWNAAHHQHRLKPSEEFFSRENRFSLGLDEASGRHYAEFPVTIGVADFSEYYMVDDESYARFLADPALALAFVNECRNREHDDLLMQKPGWNRGIPM